MPEEGMGFLRRVLQYELDAAERYRRFVSLVMIASSEGIDRTRQVLNGTIRSSDILAESEDTAVVLMSETDSYGALSAIERYRERGGNASDLRFSLVTYPSDGGGADSLFSTAMRRLQSAVAGELGNVVTTG